MGIRNFFSIDKKSPEAKFWDWFKKNQQMLSSFERDRDRVFQKLQSALSRVHPNLTFEFGIPEDGLLEFVISADGNRQAFPAVESLHTKAPELPGWKFSKFRPRRSPLSVQVGDFRLSPDDLEFDVVQRESKADITVYVRGHDDCSKELLTNLVFLMLDQAIGEYDVATRIGFIDIEHNSKDLEKDLTTFKELPGKIDALF